MYPSSSSSSSSSSQKSMSSNSGLIRYGSAPGSFLNAVDSVIGSHDFTGSLGSQAAANPHHHHHHHHQPPHQRPPPPPSLLGQYFSAADSSSVTSESNCKVNASDGDNAAGGGLQRSFGFSDLTVGGGSSSSCPQLVRQRSSPAGFLSHLAAENAFSLSRGGSSCNNNNNGGQGQQLGGSRLKSQLSFTRQDSQLSQISEVSESMADGVVVGHGNNGGGGTHSASFTTTTSFGIDSSSSWPDNHHNSSNSIVFSAPPPAKRHRTTNNNISMDGDIYTFHHPLETQFSMPETSLEMAAVERMLHVPDDSIPCKIRAKRGCATHPRSIAERERRTRISGRLKKLQDLVPNMDKQTSYSDMLDLAVQHIRTLQTQVQKLRHDLDNCKCGCKPTS